MGTAGRNARQRDGDDPRRRLRENATGIASMLVTGIWLALLFLPGDWPWLAVMLFGYIVVVPLVAILFGDEEDRREWWDGWSTDGVSAEADVEDDATRSGGSDRRDALETLRERYAAGELTDEQFERKLERLLDTETLEDAQDRVRNRSDGRRRDRGGADGRDRDEDVEYEL